MVPTGNSTFKSGLASHRSVIRAAPEQDATLSSSNVPLMRPDPPRLSDHARELAEIENSGIYSNFGPVNRRLELDFVETFFGEGECLTVCNATIGLMIAIRSVLHEERPKERRFAMMPSFTFAAAAHAAMWAGLTPLLCDIDPDTWLPDAASEELLLQRYAGQIAAIVPYATFGNNLDLAHYQDLSERYAVPIVVDAAASLGSVDRHGRAFGSGFDWPVVFSMHATKLFATGEGGIIHCRDKVLMARLRAMASFGFEEARVATMIGINAKMTEVAALTASLQLRRYAGVVERRENLARWYADALPAEFNLQVRRGHRQAHAFGTVLLPERLAMYREQIRAELRSVGIGTATYFSPHLAVQPYFEKNAVWEDLRVTMSVASRIVTLPMYDEMTERDVEFVTTHLERATRKYDLIGSNADQSSYPTS